ncbi:MAG: flavodoxin [Erysipelotrichaceae bacterium]|nr:flavodoxin [Erysipelotrichaceae bacterium]
MNKKIIIGIVAVIVMAVIGTGGYFLLNNDNKTKENENTPTNIPIVNEPTEDDNKTDHDNTTTPSVGKTLVVYYSASGSTKKVADQIAENLNADLFEIEPVDAYTSADLDWTDNNSRVTKEHNDESLRDIKLKNTKVDKWDCYDTVLIGYPIWWGIAAWPVDTFVKANDFGGKTVIPFCTSASSGLGESGNLLAKEAKNGNWKEGHRFSSGASTSDIKTWTDSLK